MANLTWREQLRPGSFRGVAFGVADTTIDGGRRVAIHEFPQRDRPFAEDLGRSARHIQFSAFYVGQNYQAQRDALLAALDAPGAGELIYPSVGPVMVTALKWSVHESRDQGGFCEIALEFVESGDLVFPRATADTQAQVSAAADTASTAAKSDFAQNYSANGDQAASDAMSVLGQIAALLAGLRGQLSSVLDAASGLIGLTAAQVTDPSQVSSAVEAGIAALGDNLPSLMTVAQYRPAVPDILTTPSRLQIAANRAALGDLVNRLALADVARAAAGSTPSSYQDAVALRDRISAALDNAEVAAADAGQGGSYRALADLRASVVRDLTARGADLSPLVTQTLPRSLPSLVVAQRLYQDASRASEISARNNAIHPGFLPTILEALAE